MVSFTSQHICTYLIKKILLIAFITSFILHYKKYCSYWLHRQQVNSNNLWANNLANLKMEPFWDKQTIKIKDILNIESNHKIESHLKFKSIQSWHKTPTNKLNLNIRQFWIEYDQQFNSIFRYQNCTVFLQNKHSSKKSVNKCWR